MSPSQPAARRRTPEQLRTAIRESAQELFNTQGYEATTTKAIAEKAGVLEPQVFTSFGSKAALFDATVVDPFKDLVADYMNSWRQRSADISGEQRVGALVEGLFDLTRKHRTLLLSALMQRESNPDSTQDPLDYLAQALSEAIGVYDESVSAEYPGIDPDALTAIMGAMIFGSVLLDNMIFPRGRRRPSRARMITEMRETLMHGVTHRLR